MRSLYVTSSLIYNQIDQLLFYIFIEMTDISILNCILTSFQFLLNITVMSLKITYVAIKKKYML